MDAVERAQSLFVHKRLPEAALAYEDAVLESNADLDILLDLAVLYFELLDGGAVAHYRLSVEFQERAWSRFHELLEEAERKFGREPEIVFWRRYFRFIHLGEEPFPEEAERMAHAGTSLVPYFHLWMLPGGKRQYHEQARVLFEQMRDGSTPRKRYIRSILESARDRSQIKDEDEW